ncbi:hypothetical protein M5K25_002399 [Dendrobium thyrsiflorum]|uniref:Uncharacterized protein n=1 Tax=Dendrobium thyrsiflorum TaxID=117978 RepID=A0ABD0VM86_DENTH
MSPNQGLKALLEGSNRNSDYQTVSKFDNLIRLDKTNPTSLRTQKSDISKSENRTSNRPRSRDSISASPISSSKGTLEPKLEEIKGEPEDRSGPLLLLDHRRSTAGPPPKGPTTFCLRPDALLKARRSAQGQTFCSRPDALLKARHSAQGQTSCSRPDLLLKARHPAQGPTSCSRLDVLPKAGLAAQGQTSCSRPDLLLKARHSAQGPMPHSRPDVLPVHHLTPDILSGYCQTPARCRSSAELPTNT